jgi:CubicO group peptidase (beta-lactamase class C family)
MRSTPEAEGIPSSAILDFIHGVEQHEHPLDAVQGFMLLRHGNVAAEGWWAPYSPESPHALFSVSKSFTSTGIGLAVAEGLLTVDDPVLDFFPDDAPANPGANLQAMRVRHLLAMNTGHQEDTTGRVWRGEEENWPRAFLSLPVEHEPGTWFVYNTAATYMLSAIITKLTGEPLIEYLRPRLFDPLGIENPRWETDPRGISIGGSGLHLRTEGIARLGQLYLDKGMWQGRRILPEAWIAGATSAHSDNSNTQTNPDWTVGYGYQFWRCRHDAYRADGAFGQYIIVLPGQDAVLAITSGLRDMQAVLDNVWEHLLPAMQDDALPADPRSHGELCDTLATLSLPLPERQPSSPRAEEWSGKTYDLEKTDLNLERNNLGLDRVAITFGRDCDTLVVGNTSGDHPLEIGHATWRKGTSGVLGNGAEPVAAAGAWTADDIFEMRICSCEGVFCPVIRFRFADDTLRLDMEPNASWGPATTATISGRLAR